MLVRLLYASRAAREIDEAFVASILEASQKHNAEHGITGILCTYTQGNVFLQVLEEFRQRYVVSYSPSGVSREGWHQLVVRVKGRSATVRARPGYLAGGAM